MGLDQVAWTGSTSASLTGSPGSLAAARAMATASLAVASISSGSVRADAANPQ